MAEQSSFNPNFMPFSSGYMNTGFGGFRRNKADLDYTDFFQQPKVSGKTDAPETPETPEAPTYGGDPLPKDIQDLKNIRELLQITPEEYQRRSEIDTEQAVKRTQALMPFQQYAGDVATQRALSASQKFLRAKVQEQKLLDAFRQTLPTTRQAIASARQQQSSAASSDLVSEAQAMALQSDAARNFATAGLGYNRYLG